MFSLFTATPGLQVGSNPVSGAYITGHLEAPIYQEGRPSLGASLGMVNGARLATNAHRRLCRRPDL